MYKPGNVEDEHWNRHTHRNRMVGLPINPTSLFVYWEVDSDTRLMIAEHFVSGWNELPFYLCLYDVTDCWFDGHNAPLVERPGVPSEADNWYFHSLSPHRNYMVDLATTTIHNHLFSIYRSNVISLPPGKVTPAKPYVQFVSALPPSIPEPSAISRHEETFDGYHIVEPGGDRP